MCRHPTRPETHIQGIRRIQIPHDIDHQNRCQIRPVAVRQELHDGEIAHLLSIASSFKGLINAVVYAVQVLQERLVQPQQVSQVLAVIVGDYTGGEDTTHHVGHHID